jgi:hypothetical protein
MTSAATVDDQIEEISVDICASIAATYKVEPKITIDQAVIRAMLESCLFIGKGKWLVMLGADDFPIVFSGTDAVCQLRKRFGHPVKEVTPPPSNADGRKAAWGGAVAHVFDAIKYYNQRQASRQTTDMFADRSRMSLANSAVVQIILAHQELSVNDDPDPDPEVVADYKEHFPEFDEVLDAIVAAKFAPDRKEAYLWLHCASDWGKGFLIGVFRELGIVTEISVSEAEKAFTGSPVALSELDFYNSFVVTFDEFKNVKAELKQLQNYIMLSPKNQLRVECELHFKLFLSKEAVHSLAGDQGIDDQFANRFALIHGKSTIVNREMFQAKSKGHYRRAVAVYAAGRINERVDEYRDLGRDRAERKASEALTQFHKKYGIDRHYDRSSTSLKTIAEEFGAYLAAANIDDALMDKKERMLFRNNIFKGEDGNYYLKSPAVVFGHWVEDRVDRSELKKVSMAKDEVFEHLSADGEGSKMRKVKKGMSRRAVLLKPEYETVHGDKHKVGQF